jgi:hypothetical protein
MVLCKKYGVIPAVPVELSNELVLGTSTQQSLFSRVLRFAVLPEL